MTDLTWYETLLTATAPIAVALVSAGVIKSISPTGRLEKQIRAASELVHAAGDDSSVKGVRAVREHVTALWASRILVRGHTGVMILYIVAAAVGGFVLLVGASSGALDILFIGGAYLIFGLAAATWLSLRTIGYRERTYRALRVGRPSALIVIDVDASVARNVRRSVTVSVGNERRSRRRLRRESARRVATR